MDLKKQKTKLKSFSVCHSGLITGEFFKAKSVLNLMERLPKSVRNNWETISFVDSENRNICVTREFMENDGMTIEETINDWVENGDIVEPITAFNPKRENLSFGLTVTLTEFGFVLNEN